ncbi:IS3 family transposase [Tepidiphilus succinatimandens]|uniref:IS3 family transposase n=1 Tax=Tepidiphilus succinatimandens TaxID=224436 RepID=UPI00112F5A68
MTYLWTDEGWLYLAIVLGLWNRDMLSWVDDLKNERVHGCRYATRAKATAGIFEYIEVFGNRKRRYSTLG